jgi:hypothetical protein
MKTQINLAGVAEVALRVSDLKTVIGTTKENHVQVGAPNPNGVPKPGRSLACKNLSFAVAPGAMKEPFLICLVRASSCKL